MSYSPNSYSKDLYEISFPDKLGPTGFFDKKKCDVKIWEYKDGKGRTIRRVDIDLKEKEEKL